MILIYSHHVLIRKICRQYTAIINTVYIQTLITFYSIILYRLCVWLCQSTELHIMNEEKILQRLYNLLEDAYRTFYHIVFLEVSKSYGVIPDVRKLSQ